jgi:inner membrane protein involved in colicin E2 resistance
LWPAIPCGRPQQLPARAGQYLSLEYPAPAPNAQEDTPMLIIAILYIGITWLVFFRFKLLPWNWPWRIVTLLVGCAILAVFIALLNTLTHSGRIAVVGRSSK